MSKRILLIALVIVLFLLLMGLAVRGLSTGVVRASATATESRPFGPGWAADYGTYDEGNNQDGLDESIERMLHKKRP